ncbi:MAG TPA: helix-turn-helix domain-containing protein [Clostridiaceae bacterium]|jgi:transcriptional regulator with XRE-family HTH domain|nr:helix-turn-helix domain-containing protein [Clostridiaceae bacterium]
MNQIKIGKFIAKCRKKNNLTQMQLAEKLNITDRAISKWKNGKGMPDSSIMLDLCNELKISVNELLCGELIEMNNYNEVAEKMLLEMAQYVPKYSQVYFAMHSGTTRYMKCPKCNKKSWQRKTLSK